MNRLLGLLATAAFALAATTASAQNSPDPTKVYIKRITYSGPGCPDGSVAHNLAPDAQAFTLLFSDFLVEAGPGVPPGKNKTSCRVIVDLRIPPGWTYSLLTVDYRGYASLQQGVNASKKSYYYFQASPNRVTTFEKVFTGPFDDDFSIRDTATINEIVWSDCNHVKPFNIDTELSVSNAANPQASGTVTIDSMDGALKQIYAIRWKQCP